MARIYHQPHTDEIELHDVLRVLGDPIRLEIVAALLEREETMCSPLAEELGIADSTLSHHLRQMREAGLTHTRPVGVQRWTSLRTDDLEERFPGMLAWLRRVLAEGRNTRASAGSSA